MMVELYVKFKPNTNEFWACEKIAQTLKVDSFLYSSDFSKSNDATVLVPEEDVIRYSRAIRMISPQIISVSRA